MAYEAIVGQSCGTCRFWLPFANECRRHPPNRMGGHGESLVLWPKVGSNEWCGEWEKGATPPMTEREIKAAVNKAMGELKANQ